MILKPLTNHEWRGYTLDELQEQQIITDARIMMQKKALVKKVDSLKSNAAGDTAAMKKMSTVVTYIDYFMFAVSLFRKIIPYISRWRKNRKQSTTS